MRIAIKKNISDCIGVTICPFFEKRSEKKTVYVESNGDKSLKIKQMYHKEYFKEKPRDNQKSELIVTQRDL